MAYVICSILAIFDKNDKKMTKNDIYDINGAYEICHMTVIYMLIWVLNEASGSQECSPAFETRSKNYFQRKKEENLATSFFLCILKNFLCIFKSAGLRSILLQIF